MGGVRFRRRSHPPRHGGANPGARRRRGGVYQPLVVTPAIGVRVEPEARLLPLDGSPLPVSVTVHAERAAEGTVESEAARKAGAPSPRSNLSISRARATPNRSSFRFLPPATWPRAPTPSRPSRTSDGKDYSTGWQSIGYTGLRPYNQYKPAELRTRKVDVKLAPGLRVGYVMGTGDTVPEAIEALGITPHLLSDDELATADLSQWNVIVVGIRAYSVRPELAAAESRLEAFVERGGTLARAVPDQQLSRAAAAGHERHRRARRR